MTNILVNFGLVTYLASALPALASINSSPAQDCLAQANADFAEGTGSADRIFSRDSSRCFHLPSIEVKQACSNLAFENRENRLKLLRAEHSANVQACQH